MSEQALPSGAESAPGSAVSAWEESLRGATPPDGLFRLRRLAARLAASPDALDLLRDIDAIALELQERQLIGQRLSLLAEATELLDARGDIEPTLARMTRLVVPRLADGCAIYLLEERGQARYVASDHADPRLQALVASTAASFVPRPDGRSPTERALQSGSPVLLSEVTLDLFTEGLEPEPRELRPLLPRSWMAVPLRAGGRTLGVISLTVEVSGRHYGPADLELVRELAERISLSVENALLMREAEEARAQLDTLFRTTPVALALLDRDLRYVRVNDAAAALLGRPAEALIGRSARRLHPALAQDVEGTARRLIDGDGSQLTTEVAGTPPGRTKPGHWLVTLYVVRTASGKRLGLGAAVVDITARKEAELAAQAARATAEAASLAKSQFLALMSHELRTPLTTVIGYADLLMGGTSGAVNERQRDQLARIKTSAWHLVGIIEEILTFSRAEAGKEKVVAEMTDLAALGREAANIIEPRAHARGLVFRGRGLEGNRRMVTDADMIRQILLNLLGNAVKFTEAGEVELEFTPVHGTGATFHVRDTGPGIAEADLERIFEPFHQLDQSNTRQKGGTGLGLTISRQLARLLGGDVTVTSRPGVGSTFTLHVPAMPRQSATSTVTSALPSGE